MDHIDLCHQHHHSLSKTLPANLLDYLRTASLGPQKLAAASTYHPELEELEEDYEVEMGNYNPVQPLLHDHAVCMIPISSPHHKIDHHILQVKSTHIHFSKSQNFNMLVYHRPYIILTIFLTFAVSVFK